MRLVSRLGAVTTVLLLFALPARAGESRAAMTVGLRILAVPPGFDARAARRGRPSAVRARIAALAAGRSTIRITFGGLSSNTAIESQTARHRRATLR
jgi:hypothetical protein